MNDQAKKLRELAQKIREERDRANMIIDPTTPPPEKVSITGSIFSRMMRQRAEEAPKVVEISEPTAAQAPPAEAVEQTELTTGMPAGAPVLLDDPSPSAQPHATRIIAVASGKGGVGKSNLVANLGIALAMRGRKVMVLDADLGLANIDVLFGINPKFTLQHLVDDEKTMEEILVDGPHGIRIVPGGSGIPELANLSDENQQKLIEHFVRLDSEADIMLIDTGAGISKDIIAFILAAREAVIITTPEPTAITDAYGLIKVLTQRDMDVDIKIVVNMVSSEREGREIADRIVMATKQFLRKRIEILGYMISDPSVNMSVRKQEPFIIGYPSARASRCIKDIAARLDTTSVRGTRNGFRGFLSRLFER